MLALGSSALFVEVEAGEQANAAAMSQACSAPPIAAVLTTDCGVEIDDQWALAHLLLSPEIDLRAVITTHASSIRFSSATSARKAAEVVAQGQQGQKRLGLRRV